MSSKNKTALLVTSLWLILSLGGCGLGGEEPAATPSRMPAPTHTPEQTEPTTAGTPTSTPTVGVPSASPTSTPTPTPPVPAASRTPRPPLGSACAGLGGELEVRVLVGPAAAAQMEPVAVGSVPFAVTTQTEPFVVHGEGHITYDQVLEKDWGTYAVTLNLDSMVDGECVQGTRLDAILEMSGHQNVKVDAGEFQAEYPWEGGHTLPLDLPLEEGATTQAEGWEIVLHLNGQ